MLCPLLFLDLEMLLFLSASLSPATLPSEPCQPRRTSTRPGRKGCPRPQDVQDPERSVISRMCCLRILRVELYETGRNV